MLDMKKLSVKSAEELRTARRQQWGRTKVVLMREDRRWRKEEREWSEGGDVDSASLPGGSPAKGANRDQN